MMKLLALMLATARQAGAVELEVEGRQPGDIFGCFFVEEYGSGSSVRLRMTLATPACPSAPLDDLPGAVQPNPNPSPKVIKQAYGGTISRYMAPGEMMGGSTHGVGWGARNFHGGNGNGPPQKAGEQTDYVKW